MKNVKIKDSIFQIIEREACAPGSDVFLETVVRPKGEFEFPWIDTIEPDGLPQNVLRTKLWREFESAIISGNNRLASSVMEKRAAQIKESYELRDGFYYSTEPDLSEGEDEQYSDTAAEDLMKKIFG